VGNALLLNKRKYLLPFKIKMRMMIDSTGEIYLVILARPQNKEMNVALYASDRITDVSANFLSIVNGFDRELDTVIDYKMSDLCQGWKNEDGFELIRNQSHSLKIGFIKHMLFRD
jgi:hypothetical protein